MDVSTQEIMMLLGEKDLIIFQQHKKINELDKQLKNATELLKKASQVVDYTAPFGKE